MLLWWLAVVIDSGIISLKLLLIALALLVGPSAGPLTKRQILREMKERAGGEESDEPEQSPEDFLRQLEQDEKSRN